jgi:2-polyprenyl-6-hydroxyphenyl methylase / 3-demethylubiquinone-9 3-methyltransferase
MENKRRKVNNAFYDTLNDQWQGREDHPIALLLAENAVRTPWISSVIKSSFSNPCHVLDIGCGGGHLTNPLAQEGHKVVGIDLSEPSLAWAKKQDVTESVRYLTADAKKLPMEEGSFDIVCAMDLLEHVDNPEEVIKEASRVLKPGGYFFFHTFNRTWLSYLLVIKGVEWFVKNTPPNMHVYSHFIKPSELNAYCSAYSLKIDSIQGFVPDAQKKAFWKTAINRKIDKDFSFIFSKSLLTGYVGYAKKM